MSEPGHELFKGYTGQIVIDGDALTLSRHGLAAKAAGAGGELRIPLKSVSAVDFKAATRMTNGSLRLGLNGNQPADERDAAKSPTAVLFTWQQREEFERLHGWLVHVVELNRALDPSAEPEQASPATDTAPSPRAESTEVSTLGSVGSQAARSQGALPTPAPNWYPDPTRRFQLRYWDGAVWTEHVAHDGAQSADPYGLGASSPGPTQPVVVESTVVPADTEGANQPKKPGMLARRREERQSKAAGRDEFETIAMHAATGDPTALAALPEALLTARSLYRAGPFEKKLWDVMAVAVRSVISDDLLTSEEEQHLDRLGEALGTPVQELEGKDFQLFEELVIAGINAGRLPRLETPGILLKRGELAYASFAVSLMKEQAVRQYRAGTSSVSIPLGGGVRYRVGGVRGHSVVVGSELVVQDSGQLVITSQRALFAGQSKTLEFRNDRLVGLEQFADGLRLNVSNRQTASLFRLKSPSIAAALISASVARNT